MRMRACQPATCVACPAACHRWPYPKPWSHRRILALLPPLLIPVLAVAPALHSSNTQLAVVSLVIANAPQLTAHKQLQAIISLSSQFSYSVVSSVWAGSTRVGSVRGPRAVRQ